MAKNINLTKTTLSDAIVEMAREWGEKSYRDEKSRYLVAGPYNWGTLWAMVSVVHPVAYGQMTIPQAERAEARHLALRERACDAFEEGYDAAMATGKTLYRHLTLKS
jgi:hypothetical protein